MSPLTEDNRNWEESLYIYPVLSYPPSNHDVSPAVWTLTKFNKWPAPKKQIRDADSCRTVNASTRRAAAAHQHIHTCGLGSPLVAAQPVNSLWPTARSGSRSEMFYFYGKTCRQADWQTTFLLCALCKQGSVFGVKGDLKGSFISIFKSLFFIPGLQRQSLAQSIIPPPPQTLCGAPEKSRFTPPGCSSLACFVVPSTCLEGEKDRQSCHWRTAYLSFLVFF